MATRNPRDFWRPGMVLKPCKQWEKLPNLNWLAGFFPSTVPGDSSRDLFIPDPCRSPTTSEFGSGTSTAFKNASNLKQVTIRKQSMLVELLQAIYPIAPMGRLYTYIYHRIQPFM